MNHDDQDDDRDPCPPTERAPDPPSDVPFVDTCIEHGPGGTVRLSFQVRVF